MFARYLILATADVLQRLSRFDAPADITLAQFQRENPKLGSRDRHQIANAAFAALRFWPLIQSWLGHSTTPTPANSRSNTAVDERLGLIALALDAQGLLTPPLTSEQHLEILQRAKSWDSAGMHHAWLDACMAKAQTFAAPLTSGLQHNLPEWLAQTLQAQYGDAAFGALAQSLKQTAPLDLRVNLLTHKRNVVLQQLAEQGIVCAATPYSPWGLRLQGKPSLRQNPLMQSGALEVQDEGSQLLALLTGAKRGETVVDFCAGAGGKTLALGAMMRNTGRLYALDNSAHRLDGLQPRLKRSGLNNVHTLVLQSETDERLARLRGKADRVLVDAPCSGLGTLRRHPELAWRNSLRSIEELQQTQRRILDSAASLLKPGGTLVYATCSLLEQENGAVNHVFTQANASSFTPFDWTATLEKHGLTNLQKPGHHAGVPNAIALLPHLHQTDGFYVAAWQKNH
ncbi:RsmB/NOP family class I SAM-dependent RNA methyltransferase [Lampropedia puyangensis]|uniref:RsmB/NOP family class I SAM-dependent RNA methyltransferase n=1 Tax=Lampropedia puyangensis TaxID=1330072 RepID=A0A4S8ETN6_9BURK|nr:RsmB/NOP family class I SAM-dependent RNA methyltransferase [Lampropedia puyangensis]THT97846.1 RsmB/NOP family class I SAM-dependent RNA methyltransferase [Lampropedia puyangensis]